MTRYGLLILVSFAFWALPGSTMSKIELQSGENNEEVKQLLAIVRDQTLRQSSPDQVVNAIKRLGKMKAVEAVNDLVQLITFNPDADQERAVGIITERSDRYPAVSALFLIGKPSLPALIKVIEEHDKEELTSRNALHTIMSIFRGELPAGVKYLQDAANKASSGQR